MNNKKVKLNKIDKQFFWKLSQDQTALGVFADKVLLEKFINDQKLDLDNLKKQEEDFFSNKKTLLVQEENLLNKKNNIESFLQKFPLLRSKKENELKTLDNQILHIKNNLQEIDENIKQIQEKIIIKQTEFDYTSKIRDNYQLYVKEFVRYTKEISARIKTVFESKNHRQDIEYKLQEELDEANQIGLELDQEDKDIIKKDLAEKTEVRKYGEFEIIPKYKDLLDKADNLTEESFGIKEEQLEEQPMLKPGDIKIDFSNGLISIGTRNGIYSTDINDKTSMPEIHIDQILGIDISGCFEDLKKTNIPYVDSINVIKQQFETLTPFFKGKPIPRNTLISEAKMKMLNDALVKMFNQIINLPDGYIDYKKIFSGNENDIKLFFGYIDSMKGGDKDRLSKNEEKFKTMIARGGISFDQKGLDEIANLENTIRYAYDFDKHIAKEKIPVLLKNIEQFDEIIGNNKIDDLENIKNLIAKNFDSLINIFQNLEKLIYTKNSESISMYFRYHAIADILFLRTKDEEQSIKIGNFLLVFLLLVFEDQNSDFDSVKGKKLLDFAHNYIYERDLYVKNTGAYEDSSALNLKRIISSMDIYKNQNVLSKKINNIIGFLEEENEKLKIKYREFADSYFVKLPDFDRLIKDQVEISIHDDPKNNQLMEVKNENGQLVIYTGKIDEFIKKELIRQALQEIRKISREEAEKDVRNGLYNIYTDDKEFNLIVPRNHEFSLLIFVINKSGELTINGVDGLSVSNIIGDTNYEKLRAVIFYYLYHANTKIDLRGSNKEDKEKIHRPPAADDIIKKIDPRYIYDNKETNDGINSIVKYRRGHVRMMRCGRFPSDEAFDKVAGFNKHGENVKLFAWIFAKGQDPKIDEPISKIEITNGNKLECYELAALYNTTDTFICFDTWVSEHKKNENDVSPVRLRVGKMSNLSTPAEVLGDISPKNANLKTKTGNQVASNLGAQNKSEKNSDKKESQEEAEAKQKLLDLVKKIINYLTSNEKMKKGTKEEKDISKYIKRLGKKSFGARGFDFERFEKKYDISLGDEDRKEIKTRSIKNGWISDNIYIEEYSKEINPQEQQNNSIEEVIEQPTDRRGRIDFLENQNIYVSSENAEHIKEVLIEGKKIGQTAGKDASEILFKKILNKQFEIKYNKRKTIEMGYNGRAVFAGIKGGLLLLDICSYDNDYEKYNEMSKRGKYKGSTDYLE